MDRNHRGSVGGHVKKDERTRRIWTSPRPVHDRISRLQGRVVIEFYDNAKKLVHTYKDEGNKLGVWIKIFDTPKEVAIWTLAGVNEDSWWQQYAPGLGDALAHEPDQYYVPQARMNILCTGRQADDAMCEYLADVFHNKQKGFHNSAVFVGAGVLGGTSWIDKHVQTSSQRIQFRTEYPWGEVVQRIALAAAKSGTQVIVEIPPEAHVAGTKQHSHLLNKELWKHNVIDGCSHGQRLLVRDSEDLSHVKYCNRKWEFFTANTAMEPKSSDVCKAKHEHACEQDYTDLRAKEMRTSQVSRRLLRSLSFVEGDGKLISMPAKKPKSKCDGVVVQFGHSSSDDSKKTGKQLHVLNVEPPRNVAQETELVAKIKKLSNNRPSTPVLFTASLSRPGAGLGPKAVPLVGGEGSPVGKLSEFRGVLRLLKRLMKRFCESPHVYFSLDMPSTCSCWNWPELHALLGSRGFKVKAAECADATGRLIGRRCVISNFLDSKRVEEKFASFVERKLSCKLSDCIREAWASVALHVRSTTRHSQCIGRESGHASEHGLSNSLQVCESSGACSVRSHLPRN